MNPNPCGAVFDTKMVIVTISSGGRVPGVSGERGGRRLEFMADFVADDEAEL